MSAAIPTVYRNVRFRSRLEATWAAFFDEVKWPWRYEPIDLAGYIPDFLLDFRRGPVLVEVKPIVTWGADADKPLAFEAMKRVEASGWRREFLLVGTGLQPCLHHDGREGIGIGMAGYPIPDTDPLGWEYCLATFPIPADTAQPFWARAQNATQWEAPRRRRRKRG